MNTLTLENKLHTEIPLSQLFKIINESGSKKGKARFELKSEILLEDNRVACEMTGEFVGVN